MRVVKGCLSAQTRTDRGKLGVRVTPTEAEDRYYMYLLTERVAECLQSPCDPVTTLATCPCLW